MAIDVYLQIDGIRGESTDIGHQGWIEVTSAHLADGQGDRIKYCEVELENVLIASANQAVHEGDVLHESLEFSKVRWRYTQQTIAGGAAGNTSGGWDLASNRFA